MSDEEGLRTTTIAIDGMRCERCVNTVKDSLRYIDRMIESNQKNFGDERLDCCNLSSKKR